MVNFFCLGCGKSQEVEIEPMKKDDLNGETIWGDVVCSICHLVIATITVDEPGVYDFVKVDELEQT